MVPWKIFIGNSNYTCMHLVGIFPTRFLKLCGVCGYVQMQYSFIYQALLEYFLYGDTELDVSSLEGHLQKLHNTCAPQDRLGLDEEFKVSTIPLCWKRNWNQQPKHNDTMTKTESSLGLKIVHQSIFWCVYIYQFHRYMLYFFIFAEADQYAHYEGKHENRQSTGEYEEEPSAPDYSM